MERCEHRPAVGHVAQMVLERSKAGDDLIPMLGGKLNDLNALITDTKELLKKFEKAIGSEQNWTADKKPLVQEGNKFISKMENNELKAFFAKSLKGIRRGARTRAPPTGCSERSTEDPRRRRARA